MEKGLLQLDEAGADRGVEDLVSELRHHSAQQGRINRPGDDHRATRALAERGPNVRPHGLAERVVAIAKGGLVRRKQLDGAGNDESIHLAPLEVSVARGESPGTQIMAQVPGAAPAKADVVAATRL